jgi:ABC-type Zn2+ transport system substrate-binding protein/surface adhesin
MAWIQTASWWSRTRHNCSSAPCTNPLSLALSLFLSSFSCLAIERCTQRRKQSGGQGRDTTAARLSVRAYIHTHTHTHKHTHTHTHMHTHTHAHTHTYTHTRLSVRAKFTDGRANDMLFIYISAPRLLKARTESFKTIFDKRLARSATLRLAAVTTGRL